MIKYKQGLVVRKTGKNEVIWVRTNSGDAEPYGALIGQNVENMMSHHFHDSILKSIGGNAGG